MGDNVEQLWREHKELGRRTSALETFFKDLSSQVERDRAVFSRQIKDLEQRQTALLIQVSKDAEKHNNNIVSTRDDILASLERVNERVQNHENDKLKEEGMKMGASGERKKLVAIFTIILTGIAIVGSITFSGG